MAHLSYPANFEENVRTKLGPGFKLGKEIGRGMTGIVYHATDRRGTQLAIKVLRPEFAATVAVDRFQREASIMSTLKHPGIMPVYEIGEDEEVLYFVMPYAGSITLRTILDRETKLPIPQVVALLKQLADAVDYAHGQNVIHRDLKPENVIAGEDGVLICDFGVARAIIRLGADRLTTSGLVIGTPEYMSPEQGTGSEEIGPTTDTYALGCMAYELITGEVPFIGRTVQSLIARHVRDEPRSLRLIRADVPAHIEHAVLSALAKEPDERPPTAGAFAALLDR